MTQVAATNPKTVRPVGKQHANPGSWGVQHSGVCGPWTERGLSVPSAGCSQFCGGPGQFRGEAGSLGRAVQVSGCHAAQRREVGGSGERSRQVSWAGGEGGRVGEGIPGAERGRAKVLPARPGELDLDKDPGRCESPERFISFRLQATDA